MTDLEKTAERFRKIAEQKSGESLAAINGFYETIIGAFQGVVDENAALRKRIEELVNVETGKDEEATGEARASKA